MLLNESIIERLQEVLNESKLSKRQFADSLGASASSLNDMLSGKPKAISGILVKVLELVYGVNPVWLETGEGKKRKGKIVVTRKIEVDLILQVRDLSAKNQKLLSIVTNALWEQQHEAKDKV